MIEQSRHRNNLREIGESLEESIDSKREMTPAEIQKRKERCESIKWVIVGEDVPMVWHDGSNPSKQGWFWDFSKGGLGEVYGDESDIINKPAGYAEAVAAHEFSHVEIDFPMDVFTEEELSTRGFLIGYNWVDDNAVEKHAQEAHNSGREWMKVKARVSMEPGGGLDHKQKEIIEKGLGYIPKQHLFGGMTRLFFYKKEVTGELNINGDVGPNAKIDPNKIAEFIADESFPEDVREAFKRCYEDGVIEDIYNEIPSPLSEEEICLAVAHKRAEIYRKRFWPEYQKLVEEAQTDQNLIEFLKKLIEGAQNGTGLDSEQDGVVIVIDLNSFPEVIQEEIRKAIEKISGQNQHQDDIQDSEEGTEGAKSGESGGIGDTGNTGQPGQTTDQSGSSGGQNQSAGGSGQSEPGDAGEAQGSSGVQSSPIGEMSEDAQEAIKQAYDSLTEEARKDIEQSAKSAMGEVEDGLNEHMQASTNKEGKSVSTQFGDTENDNSGSQGDGNPPESEGSSGQSGGQGSSNTGETDHQDKLDRKDSSQKEDGQAPNDSPPPPPPEYRPIRLDPVTLEKEMQLALDALQSDSMSFSPESYAAGLSPEQRQQFLSEFQQFFAMNPQIQDWSDLLGEELFQQLRPDQRPKKRITSSPSHARIRIKEYLREWEVAKRSLKWYEKETDPDRFSVGITYLLDLSGSVLSVVEELLPDEIKRKYDQFGWSYMQQWMNTSKSAAISATILGAQLQIVTAAATAQLELHIPTQVEGFPVGKLTAQPFISREEFEDSLGDDRLSPEMQASLWGMVAESGGGTPTDRALMQSYKNIKARFEDNPRLVQDVEFIIVWTDGQPDNGPHQVRATQEAIYADAEEAGLTVQIMLFGIGPGTQFVNNLAPKMPAELFEIIQDKLVEIRGKDVPESEVGYSFSNPAEAAAVYPLILGALLKNPNLFREDDLDE